MEPSERYKQLCLAAGQSAKHYLERRRRRISAFACAAQAVAVFLGMPEGRISLTELNESLREVRSGLPIGTDISLSVG
jgi:hypothetical protein